MKLNRKTAIVLFAYNRPSHLRRVLISLEDYKIQKVYVFIDGVKNNRDRICQKEIDFMLKTNKKIKFKIYKSLKNKGLAKSIENGVSKLTKKYDRLIVLEDDCIPRKEFFSFSNQALEIFKNEKNIGAICGYQFPQINKYKENFLKTYFTKNFNPWGWAIWSSSWNQYIKERKSIKIDKINSKLLLKLSKIIKNKNKVWTLKFMIYNFLKSNLFLYPSKSLIKNIGFDGSGINSKSTFEFNTIYSSSKKIIFKREIKIDKKISEKQSKIIYKNLKLFY